MSGLADDSKQTSVLEDKIPKRTPAEEEWDRFWSDTLWTSLYTRETKDKPDLVLFIFKVTDVDRFSIINEYSTCRERDSSSNFDEKLRLRLEGDERLLFIEPYCIKDLVGWKLDSESSESYAERLRKFRTAVGFESISSYTGDTTLQGYVFTGNEAGCNFIEKLKAYVFKNNYSCDEAGQILAEKALATNLFK